MRSRDHRTKRDAAFRRGGFMPRKPLRKHPPIPRRNGGCGRTSIIRVNFCCPLSWFRFYSPSQTLGSVQINMSSTRGIVQTSLLPPWLGEDSRYFRNGHRAVQDKKTLSDTGIYIYTEPR